MLQAGNVCSFHRPGDEGGTDLLNDRVGADINTLGLPLRSFAVSFLRDFTRGGSKATKTGSPEYVASKQSS